jgi:hypothetical protein
VTFTSFLFGVTKTKAGCYLSDDNGNPAVRLGSVAFRPHLAMGLALVLSNIQTCVGQTGKNSPPKNLSGYCLLENYAGGPRLRKNFKGLQAGRAEHNGRV